MRSAWTAREWLDAHPAPPRRARAQGVEISYSHVRAYLDCPWLCRLVYTERKRPPLTPRSSLGISIHRALEAFHRGGGGDIPKLLDFYDEVWLHAGYATPQEQMDWHRKGRRILELYHAQELERRSEILAVEKDFLFPLEPHVVRGTIDRIDRRPDGGIEVIDYKTHLDFEDEEEAARNLQLSIYGMGVRECLGLSAAWLTLYYVAAGRKTTVPYDPSRDPEVSELIVRVADLVASGKAFKPDPSHCPACDFRGACAHSAQA